MTDSEILDYLWRCARTDTDRQDKPVLHEFVRWPAHQPPGRGHGHVAWLHCR